MRNLLILLLCFISFLGWTDTHYAASASYVDVNYAVNTEASAGDVVIVPAGSETWSSILVIDQAITLTGNGIGSTVITANGVGLMTINISGNHTIRISGFTLDADSHSSIVGVNNSSSVTALSDFRFHHNRLVNCTGIAFQTDGIIFGCVDNNQFNNNLYDFKHLGDNAASWNLYPRVANIGTANYLYMEDNISTGFYSMLLASGEGARWVFRYNDVDGSATAAGDKFWDAHGDTDNRGVVAFEIYENTVTNGSARQGIDYRGGTGIIFNNEFDGDGTGWGGRILVREEHDGCTIAECDGSSGGDEVQDGYLWNNLDGATPLQIIESDEFGHIEEKTSWWDDYDNDPEYFTKGLEASLPGAAADGDCYWATDTRKLYRSVGVNNWTFIYQPYTYPHPLRSGAAGEGPFASNLLMVLVSQIQIMPIFWAWYALCFCVFMRLVNKL